MVKLGETTTTRGPDRHILLHEGTVYLRRDGRDATTWYYLDEERGEWVGKSKAPALEDIYMQEVFGNPTATLNLPE